MEEKLSSTVNNIIMMIIIIIIILCDVIDDGGVTQCYSLLFSLFCCVDDSFIHFRFPIPSRCRRRYLLNNNISINMQEI